MTDTITHHRQLIQEAIANNPHITEQPSHVSLAPWFSLHEAILYAEQRGDHARIHQEALIAHITDLTDTSALKVLGFSGPEAGALQGIIQSLVGSFHYVRTDDGQYAPINLDREAAA